MLSIIIINRYLPFLFFQKKYINNSLVIYYNAENSKDSCLKLITENVIEGLKRSPFVKPKNSKVFLCNSNSLFIFFALSAYDASALTRNETQYTFLSKSDIEKNLVIANRAAPNIRNISSTIIHEIMHTEIRNHYGYLKTLFSIDNWKEEGFCDYIAQESSYGFSNGITDFKAHIKETSGSFKYFLYRLCIFYLIDYKKLTFDMIVKTDYNVEQLEKEILEKMNDGSFKP